MLKFHPTHKIKSKKKQNIQLKYKNFSEWRVYPLVIILTQNQKEVDKIHLEAQRLTYRTSINVANGADYLNKIEKIWVIDLTI